VKVRDLMSTHVVTLRADDVLVTALEVMGLRRFRHMPVVDADRQLVGLVSSRDIDKERTAGASPVEREAHLGRVKVKDIMRKKVVTTSPDDDLKGIAERMVKDKIGCVPVVERGAVVGIVTEADFVRMVGSLLDHAAGDAAFLDRLASSLRRA
jgi:CBS domain-containing membrane protein